MDREALFSIDVVINPVLYSVPVMVKDTLENLTRRLSQIGGFDIEMDEELAMRIKLQIQLMAGDMSLPAVVRAKLNQILYLELSRRNYEYQALNRCYQVPKYARPGNIAYVRLQNKYSHLEAVRYEADRYLHDLKRNRQLQELNQRMYYDQLYSQNYGRERYYSHYDEILPYRYRETERREDRQMKRNLENVAVYRTAKKERVDEKHNSSLNRNYSATKEKEKDMASKRPSSSGKAYSNDRSSNVPQPSQLNGFTFSFCRRKPPAAQKFSSQQKIGRKYSNPYYTS